MSIPVVDTNQPGFILLIDGLDDDDSGYLIHVSETPGNKPDDPQIVTVIWSGDKRRGIIYHNKKHLYDESVLFTNSALTDYTPWHSVRNQMCIDYIQWYENKKRG